LIFKLKEFGGFFLVQFFHATFNVFLKHELQKFFLFVVEKKENIRLGICYTGFPGYWLDRERDIFKNIKQVALFGVY
jgi:hypothetical protein